MGKHCTKGHLKILKTFLKIKINHFAEWTLPLFRAWIRNEDNKNIESEVLEIFKWAPELNSAYSDTALFEVHEGLLERGEKAGFKVDQQYKNLLAGEILIYQNNCICSFLDYSRNN